MPDFFCETLPKLSFDRVELYFGSITFLPSSHHRKIHSVACGRKNIIFAKINKLLRNSRELLTSYPHGVKFV